MSDPASVAAAINAIISKPKIVPEKHLAKPPFKFLYDIVVGLKDATGFASDVFSADELSAAPEEKDGKIAFLQKIIDYTVAKTGATLSVKPQKICAGLEPENTCAWLAVLAQGAAEAKAAAAAPAEKPKKPKKGKDTEEPEAEAPKKGKTKKGEEKEAKEAKGDKKKGAKGDKADAGETKKGSKKGAEKGDKK
eukprot:TRINITY_DN1892_c0_g2_i2.p2 TRINITY_DN1892_c0_g2~~TRINITY_DN1892_c0_g2_i2.p2  ORF type:complete len:193 (-),score=44.55 TRINITY_DN1892_c0_g2_i2:339-917(-)